LKGEPNLGVPKGPLFPSGPPTKKKAKHPKFGKAHTAPNGKRKEGEKNVAPKKFWGSFLTRKKPGAKIRSKKPEVGTPQIFNTPLKKKLCLIGSLNPRKGLKKQKIPPKKTGNLAGKFLPTQTQRNAGRLKPQRKF